MSKKSIYADRQWFAENLSATMDHQGITNARLARWLNVSRQIVGQWRKGEVNPTEESLAELCVALQCTKDDLLDQQPTTDGNMLSITDWARREEIPCQRARDLFTLRILTGERNTAYTILVPAILRAPEDSKQLVRMAKCRPRWVPVFHANFPRLVKATEPQLTFTDIGILVGVQSNAVSHWANRRNYPEQGRLPLIAEVLGVPVQALIGDMRL